MRKLLSTFAVDESGATAVEYAALVAFIGLAVLLVIESLGLSLQGTFLEVQAAFAGATSAP
jgi:pilus assembly protein Flp/PilA